MPQQDPNSPVPGDEVLHHFRVGLMLARNPVIPILINIIILDVWL